MAKQKKQSKNLYIVYYVAHIEDISGGPRVIVEHVNRLSARGHTVEIWTSSDGIKPYFSCSVPVRGEPYDKIKDPDVLVVTDPYLLDHAVNDRGGKPTFLLLQHDNDWIIDLSHGKEGVETYGLNPERVQFFKEGKCHLLVVSNWLKGIARDRYGIDATVIINGISHTMFYPTQPLLNDSAPKVAILYDPQEWKGFTDAYAAACKVKQSYPDLKVILIGRFMPPFPGENNTYASFSVPVIFFNRPEQADLVRIYASADVFISASWKEGFGLAGLEAMACGVPLVTTNSGGVSEYALNGKTAFVVPPRDSDAIAACVMKLLADKELHKAYAKAGLERVQKLTWDGSITQLETTFRKNSTL